MPEDFEAPPMGGENIPFKELEQEKPPVPELVKKEMPSMAEKKIKRLKLIMIGSIVSMFFMIVILVALLLKPEPEAPPPPAPSPSPSPSPTVKVVDKSLTERIEASEKQIDGLDFAETDLAFPVLDFNINFDKDNY